MKKFSIWDIKWLCPYAHIWHAVRNLVVEKEMPAAARQGAIIAIMGLCCPLFWIALYSGASREELIFHALHSGAVFAVGAVLFVVGIAKKIRENEQSNDR